MRLRTLQFALALISVSSGGVSCFYLFVYVFFLFSLLLFACSSAGTCFTCWCVKNSLSHTRLSAGKETTVEGIHLVWSVTLYS